MLTGCHKSIYYTYRMRNGSGRKTVGTIAIIAPAIAREGITKQIANQIIGLQRKKVGVCLIVLAHSNIRLLEEYGVDFCRMPILQLQQTTAYLSPAAFFNSLNITWPILRFLKKHHVGSVIAHAPYAHFAMRLVKLASAFYKRKFTLIQYFHGLQYSEYPLITWKRRIVNNLNKWLASRCDDGHISVSEIVKQEIVENLIRHPNHVVIYNNIAKNHSWSEAAAQAWQQVQLLLQQSNRKFKILIPNRIDYNKGQLFFLEVLDAFLHSGVASATDVAVFILGDGPQRREVEQMMQAKGLESIVTLTGALPNTIVQKLIQQVQLVVVPSFKEGLSFAALEALAEHCAALASRAGGIPEVIRHGETGFLFEPGNLQDCMEQLTHIYQNRDKHLVNAALAAHDLQEKFSSETNIDKLLHLLSVKKP